MWTGETYKQERLAGLASLSAFGIVGTPPGIRTPDRLIKSQYFRAFLEVAGNRLRLIQVRIPLSYKLNINRSKLPPLDAV